MNHTTHGMTEKQKQKIFNEYKKLIALIFLLNSMGLRKQIRVLYHLLTGTNEKDVEFMIADLIQKKFLLPHKIKNTRTVMLYLTKWPRSQFENDKDAKNVQALTFSLNKMLKHIFTVDYIIEKVIPDMKHQNFEISIKNLQTYLLWTGTSLLMSSSQYDNLIFYERFLSSCNLAGHTPSYEFNRDWKIASYEKEAFRLRVTTKSDRTLPPCKEKTQREIEKDSFTSEIERQKQYYNLNNLSAHNFIFEGFDRKDKNVINLVYFDFLNSIQTKKLYQNLAYILLMFQRYTNNNDIQIHTTVWLWDENRKTFMEEDALKTAYDFYRQEYIEENKVHHIYQNIGLLPSQWDKISVTYKVNNLYEKYNITND